MERKLIDYLPYAVRDHDCFRSIMAGEQPEFELAWSATDELLDNQFIMTAGSLGLSRWEQIFGIVSKGTDTLEDRRFRILTRINEELPYTLPKLRAILEALCGEGNYSAEMEEGSYFLLVKITVAAKHNYEDVQALLERVTPQNIVFQVRQLYNTHADLSPFTHARLSAYTYHGVRTESIKDTKMRKEQDNG